MATKTEVELGFAEKTQSWRLLSHFFPSKIGGKPAWLALKDLPKPDELVCSICGKPCILLLQVYAPVNDVAKCFHRAVLIFMCKEASCSQNNDSRNFKVFRCQLSKENPFYSSEPPNYEGGLQEGYPKSFQPLCEVCGAAGPKKCSQCLAMSYCSKEHQAVHWKAGHKKYCKQEGKAQTPVSMTYLLPEYEVITEPEELDGANSDSDDENSEKSEEQKMKEYEAVMKKLQAIENSLLEGAMVDQDLENMAMKESQVDKQFTVFKKRIAKEPEQVLRYDKNGRPLWVSSSHQPAPGDIPACNYCSAPRSFEFQILPQLLNILKLDSTGDSIDWGTLAVYSCSQNCDQGPVYKAEFLWKQDYSDTNNAVPERF